jgi:hypothetical protein
LRKPTKIVILLSQVLILLIKLNLISGVYVISLTILILNEISTLF